MKKKNELSLWTFPYRKLYYLTHPWKLFREIRLNIINMIHRARYGFAYSDAWSWYHWWTTVGAAGLRYLADNSHGYPGYEPWETPEKWKTYLHDMADKLDLCAETCDLYGHDKNEYKTLYHEVHNKNHWIKTKEGYRTTFCEFTVEDKEIIDKYWAREKELVEEDDEYRAKVFAEIGRLLPRFWD